MSQTAWEPPNNKSAWGVLIPQKVLDRGGMDQLTYEGLLVDKLERLIIYMDPAEQRALDALMVTDAATPRQQALDLLARAATPTLDGVVTEVKRDRDLEAYLAEEQLEDMLEAIRDRL